MALSGSGAGAPRAASVGRRDLPVHVLAQRLQLVLGGDALGLELLGEGGEGVPAGVGLPLLGGAVEHLVVGERVGVGADHLRVDQGRALAGAAPLGRLAEGARGWRGGRSRPPPAPRGRGRSAPASRCCRPRSGPRPGPRWRSRCPRSGRGPAAGGWRRCSGSPRTRPRRWCRRRRSRAPPRRRRRPGGARRGPCPLARCRPASAQPDGLDELGAGGRGRGDDVEGGVAPVGGHLAPARARVVPGPHGARAASPGGSSPAGGTAPGPGSRGRTSRGRAGGPSPRPPGPPRARRR